MVTKQSERLTMTIEECAEALGICRATCYGLAREGRLPGCFRLGDKRLIVSRIAFLRFLETGKIHS